MTVALHELVATLDAYLHGWRRRRVPPTDLAWSANGTEVTVHTFGDKWSITVSTPGWISRSVGSLTVAEAVAQVRLLLAWEEVT